MLKTNFLIVLRNLIRHKMHSFINIVGLSVGMAITILIAKYVIQEINYDSFHENADSIYRIYEKDKTPTGFIFNSNTPLPLPQTLREDFPNFKRVTSFYDIANGIPIKLNQKDIYAKCYASSSDAYMMFQFPLISGNASTILDDPHAAVITLAAARRFFGDINPIGQQISIEKMDFTIAGIMQNVPVNSIFQFDILVSDHILNTIYPDLTNRWWHGGSYTFVQVDKGQNIAQLKEELDKIPAKYFPDFLKGRKEFLIQPLKSIHLSTDFLYDMVTPVSSFYLYLLIIVAGAVLLIACFNYINLSTAKVYQRAKEIGIKKVLGSGRRKMILQLVGETTIISIIALNFAILIAKLLLPYFNQLAGKTLDLSLGNLKDILFFLLFAILTGVIASIYPALYLTRFKPVEVLYSKISNTSKNHFRKNFIVIQFLITIVLIISEIGIIKQINFMKNHDLGFDPDNLLVISLQNIDEKERITKAKFLKERIESFSSRYGFSQAALSENVPGYYFQNLFGVVHENTPPGTSQEMVVTSIDENFVDVYKFQLLEGRNFSSSYTTDKDMAVILNQSAVHAIGWTGTAGKQISFAHGDGPFKVIGVVKDTHIRSLKNNIEPIVYRYAGYNWLATFLSLRIVPQQLTETIQFLKDQWNELGTDAPFEYFFIKDKYLMQYDEEKRISKIIGTFAVLTILLACLGLFGLVAFITENRTKENGIRRINGATVNNIMLLLIKDFTLWLVIAFLIACPIAYYAIHKWLQNFAYKTEMNWWIFAGAGIAVLTLVLLTVSWQSWRAARRNPVEALRYE